MEEAEEDVGSILYKSLGTGCLDTTQAPVIDAFSYWTLMHVALPGCMFIYSHLPSLGNERTKLVLEDGSV